MDNLSTGKTKQHCIHARYDCVFSKISRKKIEKFKSLQQKPINNS